MNETSSPSFYDLINSLPDALIMADGHGNIIHVNALAELMFGYQRDEMLGHSVEILMPEVNRKAHRVYQLDYFKTPRTRTMNECNDFYGLHKKGHQFPIEISLSPLNKGDEVWGLATIRNISARKTLETNLKKTQNQLEKRVAERTIELAKINESLYTEMAERKKITEEARQLSAELAHVSRLSILGEMTSGMAHELNQPLAAISNYSQGCIRRMRNDKVDLQSLISALERVTSEATRASEIIMRFRQFARKDTLQKRRVTIKNLVYKAVELEQFEADARNLKIQIELPKKLPDVVVDEIQIQQVMVNLVRNAIEVTDATTTIPQPILVKVHRTNDTEIIVAIIDNGQGFSEEQGQQIFQPFFTTKADGLGMGLSISRSIIEAHGGRLWAKSSLNNGATFSFSLPVQDE